MQVCVLLTIWTQLGITSNKDNCIWFKLVYWSLKLWFQYTFIELWSSWQDKHIRWYYYQGFGLGSSRALSVCFPVSLFYITGLHLKFILPSNTHISDWDLINHDPSIHDPLLMNTNDPFLICTFPFSITSQVTFTAIHFSTTFTEIQTKTDLNFEKGCQL